MACLTVAALFAILWWRSRTRLETFQSQTKRERLEESAFLQRTQRRLEMLHRLVDAIEDGLFIVRKDLTVLFVNKGAWRFFPTVQDPAGRPLLECVRDHRMVELVATSSRNGQRAMQEYLVTASGKAMSVEDRVYSVEAVPLPKNEPAGLDSAVLVILRDETEKHSLEKIRKDFVANASHELRTPLSIIIGYLENLVDGEIVGDAQMQRVFTVMKKHGDRLACIVEDLLVISRMESGQADTLRLEDFDFNVCATDVIHRLTPVIQNGQAQVAFVQQPGESSMVFGDRFYWDQILFNLVGNALKENQSSAVRVTVHLRQEADTSVIEVRDNGVGIPHADLPFVFKRFYRVARHHAKDIKGTGLGLSIVKRAVEAHHGTITVESKPGVETVFNIRVPRTIRQRDMSMPEALILPAAHQ